MNRRARTRLLVATGVLVAAFAGLVAWVLWQQSATYTHVGELGETLAGERVEVSGKVQPGSVVKDAAGVRFVMVEDRQVPEPRPTVRVEYAGAAPDSLDDAGTFVLVEGTYDAAGLIVAESVKTKCPSKYRSQAEGGATPAQP